MSIISFIGEPILKNFLMDVLPFTTGLSVYLFGKGWKSLTTNYYLYVCMGLFITIFGSSGNTSGALFLCFALSLRHGLKDIIKTTILIIITIVGKVPLKSLDGYQIIDFVTMYIFLGLTYYIFMSFFKNKYKIQLEKDYSICNISKDVIDIMALRMQGLDYPEINQKLELNITDDRVRRKISDTMKTYGFKNREEFALYLYTKKVIIKTFIDNVDTKVK
jgi:hypothetical protein